MQSEEKFPLVAPMPTELVDAQPPSAAERSARQRAHLAKGLPELKSVTEVARKLSADLPESYREAQ